MNCYSILIVAFAVLDSVLTKWRRILHLESKHGALGGRKMKINHLRNVLKKVEV